MQVIYIFGPISFKRLYSLNSYRPLFGVSIFLKKSNTLIQQGCINLIKRDSKDKM